MSEPEFYIGYRSRAPAETGRFLRRVVGLVILGAAALAVTLAFLQRPFDPGTFEFGVVREFDGVLVETPVPALMAPRSVGADAQSTGPSRYLLVSQGKFGAAGQVSGFHGQTVRLEGSLIYREDQTMIELVPDSIQGVSKLDGEIPSGQPLELGSATLYGEIVDSKCYLGVMKPGRRKTHRACAVRCLSGGIPPIMRTLDPEGEPVHLLLVGLDGESINPQILDFVAEPVEISGNITRIGDQLTLFADPSSIRRLGG